MSLGTHELGAFEIGTAPSPFAPTASPPPAPPPPAPAPDPDRTYVFRPMSAQLITPLPPPPSRRNPVNFNIRADNFNDALLVLVDEINRATPGDSAAGLAQYLAQTGSGKGTALIRHIAAAAGAVERTLEDKLRERFSAKDFGAKGDGSSDDALAIALARTRLMEAGGGTLELPAGIYRADDLSFAWTSGIPIRIVGAGKGATIIRKRTGSNAAVIDLSAPGFYDIYGGLADLTLDGVNKTNDGIRLTECARFSLDRVGFINCDAGIENIGALIYRVVDCSFKGCSVGIRLRNSSTIYANLIEIVGGEIRGNTIGADIGGGQSVVLRGVDISGNGAAGNLATGGVIVRNTIDDETGAGSVEFDGCWFESNFGWGLQTENAAEAQIILNRCVFGANEAGRDISIGAARWAVLRDIIAASPGNTVSIAATNSVVEGGLINTLTDTSTNRRHNTVTSAGGRINRHTQLTVEGTAGQELLIAPDSVVSGGSANDTTLYKYGTGVLRFNMAGQVPLQMQANKLGFFGTAPAAKPTSVPVTAAGIHAALVSLGLIAA